MPDITDPTYILPIVTALRAGETLGTGRTQSLLITGVDQRTGEKGDYVSPRDDRDLEEFILSKLDNKQVGKVQVSVVREQQAERFARQVKKEIKDSMETS